MSSYYSLFGFSRYPKLQGRNPDPAITSAVEPLHNGHLGDRGKWPL